MRVLKVSKIIMKMEFFCRPLSSYLLAWLIFNFYNFIFWIMFLFAFEFFET